MDNIVTSTATAKDKDIFTIPANSGLIRHWLLPKESALRQKRENYRKQREILSFSRSLIAGIRKMIFKDGAFQRKMEYLIDFD